MFAAIGRNARFEMADDVVRERRGLLEREGAGCKLVRSESLFGARRQVAHHALHYFLLNWIQQAPHVCVRSDLRHRQRNELFGCVVSELCLLKQMLEGIYIAVPLRQEVRQVEKLLHGGEHG